MRVLVYRTSLSGKYIADACQIINKKNKKFKFAFIFKKRKFTSLLETKNLQYLRNKKFFFFKEHSNIEKIDLKYLEYFEKNIAISNIWKMISADRIYGRSYINDIYGYESNYANKNSRKILVNFVEVAKGIEKIFKKYKPNVVFVPNGLSNIDVTIIESLSKFYKVKFLTPETFRYKNFFFFCDNLENETLKIKKNYLKEKKKFKNNKKINQIFNKLTSKKDYVSADAKETNRILEKIYKKNFLETILGSKFYSILKHSYFFVLFLFGIKIYHLKLLPRYNFFSSIFNEIQLKKNLKFLSKLDYPSLKNKYVYYPLHLNPETSTLLKGNDYMNQAFLIELISKNIPSNCKLYVKEHPAMLNSHPRKISFYKRIMRLPNVVLINPNLDSRKVISKAKAVIIVDGSSGLEAILSKIPLVTMKNFNLDFLGLSVTNYNIENLYFDILKAIEKVRKVSKKEFELKIKILLKSIEESGYLLRDPDTFYYFARKETTEKEKNISAEDLATAMIKELKL